MSKVLEYQPEGVCCRDMQVQISEEGIIENVAFFGGCNGNLQGIRSLIIGMKIEDVISKLKGISCNGKPTSCPDQLAKCLIEYKSSVRV